MPVGHIVLAVVKVYIVVYIGVIILLCLVTL